MQAELGAGELIKRMAAAMDWEGVGNRQEARNVCRTLLMLARDKVEEDRRGEEVDRE